MMMLLGDLSDHRPLTVDDKAIKAGKAPMATHSILGERIRNRHGTGIGRHAASKELGHKKDF